MQPTLTITRVTEDNHTTKVVDSERLTGKMCIRDRTGAARNIRYFHIGVLCFAFAEYLLWTAGCFWPDTSLASPTFWCDLLLTLAILGLLPATRKAVDA